MQLAWSRIWTRVAVSISYDDNHYTTGTSYLRCFSRCDSMFIFCCWLFVGSLSFSTFALECGIYMYFFRFIFINLLLLWLLVYLISLFGTFLHYSFFINNLLSEFIVFCCLVRIRFIFFLLCNHDCFNSNAFCGCVFFIFYLSFNTQS